MGCEQEEDHGKGRRVDRQPTYQELLARVAQLEDRLNQQSLGLQASERRLGFQVRLLANSAEAMTATDEHFVITYWNQAAEDLFGWTAAEAVGRPCADVLAAEVPGSTREAAISRMLEEDGYWGEVTYHRKDGSPVHTEVSNGVLRGPDGELRGTFTSFRDLTARKQAAELHAFHSAVLESVRDPLWATDASFRIVCWNDAAAATFGWTADEVRGRHAGELFKTLVPGSSREDALAELMRTGEYRGEVVCHRKDGRPILAEASSRVVRGADGEVVRVVSTARDVTERKGAEEALHRSEQQLGLATQSAGMYSWELDVATGKITFSGDVKGILGFSCSDSGDVFSRIRRYTVAEDGVRHAEALQRTLRGEGDLHSVVRVVNPDTRELVWMETHATLVRDADNAAVRLVGIARNITERKRVETALKQSEQQLARDVDAMARLQKLGALSAQAGSLEPVLTEIVDAAIAIGGADFGNIQLLDSGQGQLRIAAQRGFPPWWLEFWDAVAEGQGTCGTALERGERVVVEDVEQSPIFVGTEALDIQRKAGVRAVQSTPLVSRSGKPLGMFSTHYRKPCRPDDRALRLLDLLARQAADLIEEKQTAEALREVEKRYRELVRLAPAGICELDLPTGRFTSVNDAMIEILGYSREELLAMSAFDILEEESQARFRQRATRWLSGERPESDVEYRVKARDGRIIDTLLAVSFTTDPDGRPVGANVVAQDITERRRAEDALAEKATELEAVLESIQDAVLVYDGAGRVVRANNSARTLYGVDATEAAGPVVHLCGIDGTEIRPADQPVRQALAGERVCRRPYLLATTDGAERVLEASAMPLVVDDVLVGAVSVARDITEACRAGETEERLRVLLNNNPSLVFLKDESGRYVYLNEAYEQGFVRSKEWYGKTDFDFWPQQSAELFRANDAEVMRCGGIRQFLEDSTDADGVRHCWLCYKFAFADARNRRFLGGIGIDATDRVLAEEALRDANARLEEADRRKNEFLAMLSHELRNPLAPISNSLYILDRAPAGGDQARRAKQVIERQVAQLTNLVNDLLDVTRITRNKIQLQKARIQLNETVGRVVEDYRAQFERTSIHLEFLPAPYPVAVHADPTRIPQVIGNLLQNAVKFTSTGGRTRVSVAVEAGEAVVRVADDGVGMSRETLDRLFQPFSQAEQTLDRSKGGLGLGLALVKGLVELHGGRVSAHSDGPAQGSEMVVRLPLDTSAGGDPGEPRANVIGTRRRVLIIEDNVDAAASLSEALAFGDHEVAVAHDGPAGIARAQEWRPDVVLCDIGLPGMDGYEVARALRADETLSRAFLVALSGYALPEDLQRASEAGFARHLAKPTSPEALNELLAAVPLR